MDRLWVLTSTLVLLTVAMSGCVESGEKSEAPDAADLAGTAPVPPEAVIVVRVADAEVFSTATQDPMAEDAVGNGTANGTDGDDGAADGGNATDTADNETADGGNGTMADGNETASVPADANVLVEPGVDVVFDGSTSTGDNLTYAWTVDPEIAPEGSTDDGNGTAPADANETADGNETADAGNESAPPDAGAEPTELTLAFTDPGAYNVTLTVVDELGAIAEATVRVVVEVSGPAPGTPLRDATEEFGGGQVVGGDPTCSVGMGTNDVSFDWELVDVEEDGTPSVVSKIVLDGSIGAAGLGYEMTLLDPAGEELGAGDAIELEGEFGPGVYTIEFRLCGGFSTFSDVTATASYVVRAA